MAIAVFTRDLRVHDNPVLHAACRGTTEVVPLFVHLAADASGYSQHRERTLRTRLNGEGCRLHVHANTITVVEPATITPSGGGSHFAVFTPYHRRWLTTATRNLVPVPRRVTVPPITSDPLPTPEDICSGQRSPQLAPGGETAGRRVLDACLDGPIRDYGQAHDDLAGDGTSRLSPYLHFGCVSPTEAIRRADPSTAGGEAFIRQMDWRDFHHQVLAARPDATTTDYRTRHDQWRQDETAAQAWRDGRTGYPDPIIDLRDGVDYFHTARGKNSGD